MDFTSSKLIVWVWDKGKTLKSKIHNRPVKNRKKKYECIKIMDYDIYLVSLVSFNSNQPLRHKGNTHVPSTFWLWTENIAMCIS